MAVLSRHLSEGSPVEEWKGAMAAATTALGAAVGAAGLWLANRLMGKAAFQTAINNGFKDLVDQIQEERNALRQELASERVSFAKERDALRGEIANLRQTIESLKALLRRQGIAVPATLHLQGDPPPMIELPSTLEDDER